MVLKISFAFIYTISPPSPLLFELLQGKHYLDYRPCRLVVSCLRRQRANFREREVKKMPQIKANSTPKGNIKSKFTERLHLPAVLLSATLNQRRRSLVEFQAHTFVLPSPTIYSPRQKAALFKMRLSFALNLPPGKEKRTTCETCYLLLLYNMPLQAT